MHGHPHTCTDRYKVQILLTILPLQIGELEQLLSSQVAEHERRTEDLQNLQVEWVVVVN